MPLSSTPTLRSPPILPAKRDNEGADSLETSHKAKRNQHNARSQLPLWENFLLSVSFLLRLFPDSPQMLVQTCSNLPYWSSRVHLHLCNSNDGGLSGNKFNVNIVYKQNWIWMQLKAGTAVEWQRQYECDSYLWGELVLEFLSFWLFKPACMCVHAFACMYVQLSGIETRLSRAPCSDGC